MRSPVATPASAMGERSEPPTGGRQLPDRREATGCGLLEFLIAASGDPGSVLGRRGRRAGRKRGHASRRRARSSSGSRPHSENPEFITGAAQPIEYKAIIKLIFILLFLWTGGLPPASFGRDSSQNSGPAILQRGALFARLASSPSLRSAG